MRAASCQPIPSTRLAIPSTNRRPSALAAGPLALALVAPVAALAKPLPYDFVEGFVAGDGDVLGGGLRGSLDLAEAGASGLYLHGSVIDASGEDGGSDVSRRGFDAGAGYRHAIGDFWAVEGEFAFRSDDVRRRGIGRSGVFEDDASGARLSVGFRGSVGERFEVRALAGAFEAGDRGRELVGEVGAHVLVTKRIGITTDVLFDDVGEVFRIGVRVRF